MTAAGELLECGFAIEDSPFFVVNPEDPSSVLGAGAKHTLWEPFAIFETKPPSFYQDRLETNLRKT